MAYKIACVVVTYNRKDLLLNCLKGIANQEVKPHTVYIVDNASTDGTIEKIVENGYYNKTVSGIHFCYILLNENLGGAGGFYTGMKLAHKSPELFDAIWVMDDDGLPERHQLEYLTKYLNRYDYLSPFVLCAENKKDHAFLSQSTLDRLSKDRDNNYLGIANPFNGVLYSRKLVDCIGYPKKEMFIWGDELNYDIRAVQHSFIPVLISTAIHYHPKDRQIKLPTIFNRHICVPKENWKLYCLIRNRVYNSKIQSPSTFVKCICATLLDYLYYFVKNRESSQISVLFEAIKDGINEDFSVSRKFI